MTADLNGAGQLEQGSAIPDAWQVDLGDDPDGDNTLEPGELEPAAASDGDGRELLERGRYAITRMPNGSWVINRATPICGNCQACGCGEPQDPIPVPAMVVALITMDPDKREKLGPIGAMKKLIGGGWRDE